MKKVSSLIFVLLCFGVNSLLAVPAYPRKIVVSDINGKPVEIYLQGDERLKYALTTDGYTILGDSDGWWYASITSGGDVVKSNFMLVAKEDESEDLRRFKSECPKGIKPKCELVSKAYKSSSTKRTVSAESVKGERRALVVLMQYKDLKFKKTKEEFNALFNTLGYDSDGATGSVRDFYRFASQNQLDYISDVYGPYTAQFPMAYYGANGAPSGNDMRPLELCVEAVKNLPEDVDYSLYDNNGDGLIDNMHIIFAGYGEEAGASTDAIWAHEYPHVIPLGIEVGYALAGYSCSPELRGNMGNGISNIGVICHELGHALGAMDYYDTNYNIGGEFVGTGVWDIMASGSWNDEGRTPSNFNPYVRSNVFGWCEVVELEANRLVVMPKAKIDNSDETLIYKIETGDSGDYFLLENRQNSFFDSALPGQGLMIYHVHPDIEITNSTNTVNVTHPQGIYPVCASYSEPKVKKYGNINSSECPFPGSSGVRYFSSETSPAAVSWTGSKADVTISNIEISDDGIVSFSTMADTIDKPDKTDSLIYEKNIYAESFEQNISDRFLINSIMGKEQWMSYKKGDFVVDAVRIPEATNGKGVFMLYSGKTSAVSESEALSTNINVESGQSYVLSFDIYCMAEAMSPIPFFEFFIEDGRGEHGVYSLNEITDEWSRVEIPLIVDGNSIKYRLYGRILTGGIFIDNIKLDKMENETSIGSIMKSEADIILYKFDGTCLGKYEKYCHLQPGLYIVRQGKMVKKLFLSK